MSLLKSVFGAFFGVQTEQQRQHDFQHGKAWKFILLGVIMLAALVLGLVALVQLVS